MALLAGTVSIGDHYELVLVDNLTRTQIVQYAGASGDFNPLHTDEIFATQVAGYPSVFAHGMLTMGMVGRVLTDWLGDGRLLRFRARFVKQVWPGDTLTARAEITALRDPDATPVADLQVVARNQHGNEVLIGTATARLEEGVS
jgi:acyl dehydratase